MATTKTGIMQSLYFSPQFIPWSPLVAFKNDYPDVPVIGVINPNNGPGSTIAPQWYIDEINKLKAAKIKVIGYVFTQYGARPLSQVMADMDKYRQWYKLDGIFFDEMANTAGLENYYKQLASYSKRRCMFTTVGNPGASIPTSYLGIMSNNLIGEGEGLVDLSWIATQYPNIDKKFFSSTRFDVPTLTEEQIIDMAKYLGYMYITADTLPNPYDSLSNYLELLFQVLNCFNQQ